MMFKVIIYWLVWLVFKRLRLSKNYFCGTFMTEKEKKGWHDAVHHPKSSINRKQPYPTTKHLMNLALVLIDVKSECFCFIIFKPNCFVCYSSFFLS